MAGVYEYVSDLVREEAANKLITRVQRKNKTHEKEGVRETDGRDRRGKGEKQREEGGRNVWPLKEGCRLREKTY